MWLARNKNGILYLYGSKPIRDTSIFLENDNLSTGVFNYGNSDYIKIDDNLYQEVTFDNSPIELITKLS